MNEKFSTRWKTDEKLNQLILGLSSLQNLTTLSLHGLSGGVHKTLYKAVAKSCPLLSHQNLDVRDSTVSTAVKIFHETSGMEEPSIHQAEFEEFFGLEKNNANPLTSAPS